MGKGLKDRKYTGLIDCLQKSIKADGYMGTYRGAGISIAGIFVYRGAWFGLHDIAKAAIKNNAETSTFAHYLNTNPILKFAVAQTVTSISGLISYPIDTVRRRLQMDTGRKVKIYKGTFHCFVKIMKDEGMNGMFKGALSNVLRGTGASLVLVMYDDFKKFVISKGIY